MDRRTKILELAELLRELEGNTKATSTQLVLMFNLHNYFNPKRQEYAKHCPPCVARVYKKIQAIYAEVKHEIDENS